VSHRDIAGRPGIDGKLPLDFLDPRAQPCNLERDRFASGSASGRFGLRPSSIEAPGGGLILKAPRPLPDALVPTDHPPVAARIELDAHPTTLERFSWGSRTLPYCL
jgi:hypothetical protein